MSTPENLSPNRAMLKAIRSVLHGKASDDVAMYKIGGRELTRVPWDDLLKAEAHYEALVRNERRRAAGLPRRGAKITFGCS